MRREQAKMIAQLKGIPLEYGEFGAMPYYKKVPVTHRVRRFQLGKLAIMLKDLKDEEDAALRSTEVASEDSAAAVLTTQDQNPTLNDPLETVL
eukprot:2104547-Amphidinium_carterae.1